MATFTESFNTANGATLGPDLTWTKTVGDWAIVSNAARVGTEDIRCTARAEHDCGSPDMATEIVVTTLTTHYVDAAATVRHSTSADTYYAGRILFRSTAPNTYFEIVKVVSGVESNIAMDAGATEVSYTRTLPDTVRLEVTTNASSEAVLKLYIDGVLVGTGTDASSPILTGERGGVTGYTSHPTTAQWPTVDSFSVESLAVAAAASGALSAALPFLTATASGTVPATGPVALTLPALTATVAGTVPPPSGAISAALPAITSALTGSAASPTPAAGVLASVLPAVTSALTGNTASPTPASGGLAAVLPGPTSALTGTAASPPTTGALASTLPAVTAALAGTTTAGGASPLLYNETFNTANGTTLGPNLTWSELVGDWTIVSNQAAVTTAAVRHVARAQHDTGSNDMVGEMTVALGALGSTNYTDVGVAVRMAADGSSYYALRRGVNTAGHHYELRKVAGGQEVDLLTGARVAITSTLPETWRLEVEGSTLRVFQNGTLLQSVTDTAIPTGSYGGIVGYRSATSGGRVAQIDSVGFGPHSVVPTATLAATLPSLTAALTGTATPPPPAGALSVTLPAVSAELAATTTHTDTITARFTGNSLPNDWTEYDPLNHGSIVLDGKHARLIHGTTPRDSISASSMVEGSIGLEHPLDGGDFDIAFRVDGTDTGDHGDSLGQSLTLLVYGASTNDVVRHSLYQAGADAERIGLYRIAKVAAATVGTTLNVTYNTHFGGVPNWLRLKYTAATNRYRFETSPDGVNWESNYSYASGAASAPIEETVGFTPARIVVGTNCTGTAPKPIRVARVVNMLARGDADLREAAPARHVAVRSTVNGAAGSLPAGWQFENLGTTFSTSWTGTALRLQSTGSTESPNLTGSRAALRYVGTPSETYPGTYGMGAEQDWQLYIAATNPVANANFYFTPGMAADPVGTSGLAAGGMDEYTWGGGYGLEVQSGNIRRPIRVDDDSDKTHNPVAPFSTGLDETPYHHLRYFASTPQGSFGTGQHHFLFQRIGGRYRVKEWVGTRAQEPAAWGYYDGDDFVNDFAMRPYISLSYNNNGGDCQVDLQTVEFAALLPATAALGATLPAPTSSLSGVARASGALGATLPPLVAAITGHGTLPGLTLASAGASAVAVEPGLDSATVIDGGVASATAAAQAPGLSAGAAQLLTPAGATAVADRVTVLATSSSPASLVLAPAGAIATATPPTCTRGVAVAMPSAQAIAGSRAPNVVVIPQMPIVTRKGTSTVLAVNTGTATLAVAVIGVVTIKPEPVGTATLTVD